MSYGSNLPEQSTTVNLAIYPVGENNDCISAICVDSGSPHYEIIAPVDEVPYFVKDCASTWNANAFAHSIYFVAQMAADDWQSWLEMYILDGSCADILIDELFD